MGRGGCDGHGPQAFRGQRLCRGYPAGTGCALKWRVPAEPCGERTKARLGFLVRSRASAIRTDSSAGTKVRSEIWLFLLWWLLGSSTSHPLPSVGRMSAPPPTAPLRVCTNCVRCAGGHPATPSQSVREQMHPGRWAHFLLVQVTHRGRINLTTEVNKWNKMQ